MISYIIDLLREGLNLILKFLEYLLNIFISLNIFEQLLVINSIPAFFAVILPVGRYYIFGTFFYINNPLAVYMIGIVALMTASIYFRGRIAMISRIVANIYYMAWMIYLHFSGTLSGAPYELVYGYYFNIAVPAVYVTFSSVSYLIYGSD